MLNLTPKLVPPSAPRCKNTTLPTGTAPAGVCASTTCLGAYQELIRRLHLISGCSLFILQPWIDIFLETIPTSVIPVNGETDGYDVQAAVGINFLI